MPFDMEFKLDLLAEGRLALTGEAFPEGKLTFDMNDTVTHLSADPFGNPEDHEYIVADEVSRIREQYSSFQKNVRQYKKEDGGDLVVRFIDSNNMIASVTARAGAYIDAPKELSKARAYYYYEYDEASGGSEKPYFVYVEDGDKQYRFYIVDGRVIRTITDGHIQDNGAGYDITSPELGDYGFFVYMAYMEIV